MLEGIRNKVKPGTDVLFTKACDLVDANWPESELIRYPLTAEEQSEIDKAVENAKKSDVTVVVLGGSNRTCGENKSRSSLDLPRPPTRFAASRRSHWKTGRIGADQRTSVVY